MLNVEDLWDLNLSSLNELAKNINRQLKDAEEEDFLKTEKKESTELKLAFDITLHILNTKKAEQEAREQAVDKAAKKQKLLALLAEKQDNGLRNLSEDELKAQIAALT
jgi:hypothetical protein